MTTSTSTQATKPEVHGTPPAGGTLTRWLIPVLMPVGPAAVALLRYLLPYVTADDAQASVAAVYSDPGRQSVVLWLGLVAVLTLVPGVYGAVVLLRPLAPRLTAAITLLLVPAYLSLGVLMSVDITAWLAADNGIDQPTALVLWESIHPAVGVAAGLFVLGHVSGTVLLGVAMWRTRVVPRWVAVATAISQPLHFVAAVIWPSPPLDLFAWSLTALGMAYLAAVLLRTPRQVVSS